MMMIVDFWYGCFISTIQPQRGLLLYCCCRCYNRRRCCCCCCCRSCVWVCVDATTHNRTIANHNLFIFFLSIFSIFLTMMMMMMTQFGASGFFQCRFTRCLVGRYEFGRCDHDKCDCRRSLFFIQYSPGGQFARGRLYRCQFPLKSHSPIVPTTRCATRHQHQSHNPGRDTRITAVSVNGIGKKKRYNNIP
jgi:hypothetical protein